MRFALIGRTNTLMNVAKLLVSHNYELAAVITSKAPIEYGVTHNDFKKFAQEFGVPYFYAPKITPELTIEIQNLNIDIGVGLNYVSIVPQEFINVFKFGIINAHTGDLPRYRGNAVVAWALLNGEEQIVNSIHYMEGSSLDSGDIIIQSRIEVNSSTKIKEVYNWFEQQCPLDFRDAFKKIEQEGKHCGTAQNSLNKAILRCYPRLPEDGLIDWKQSAINIQRLINASGDPFAGAFSFLDGQKIVIIDAAPIDNEEKYLGIPGQVCKLDFKKESVEVLVGNGEKVEIFKLQINDELFKPTKIIKSIRKRFRNQ